MSDAISNPLERSGGAMPSIAAAARSTGADFEFLVNTARRESNFNTQARAGTSSAAGMFQFIEQTWLAMMTRHGAKHGHAAEAAAVRETDAGRYVVDDPQRRREILDLRFDAGLSSAMAGELAAENAALLRAETGREPDEGDLYAAHFLGARGAARLINAAETDPGVRADRLFPAAASANRAIFYEGGRAKSAGEVLASLTGREFPAGEAPSGGDASRGTLFPGGTDFAGFRGSARPGLSGGGVLSPVLVELLASLEAPRSARGRG